MRDAVDKNEIKTTFQGPGEWRSQAKRIEEEDASVDEDE